jgi:hypothetical protein
MTACVLLVYQKNQFDSLKTLSTKTEDSGETTEKGDEY